VVSHAIGDYTFVLEEWSSAPRILSLRGTPERPVPGDVVLVGGHAVTLGEERHCDLTDRDYEQGRLYLRHPRGTRQLIGATVTGNDLSDEQIRQLWGIRIEHWSEHTQRILDLIDFERTCVTISSKILQDGEHALPALPGALRYLIIRDSSFGGFDDLSSLQRLGRLRLLVLQVPTEATVDARHLAPNPDLAHLDLAGSNLHHAEALTELGALRHLDLSYVEGVTDLAFLEGMPSLRALELQRCAELDLAPLSGLAELEVFDISLSAVRDLEPLGLLPGLRVIEADSTAIERLPTRRMPGLRTLKLLSTRLPDEVVADFRRANPECSVAHRWSAWLFETAEEATRIRVRSGGLCHRRPGEETLFEVADPQVIRGLLYGIDIDEARSGMGCMCCGSPTIEFYAGTELVAALSLHHGRNLRWPRQWPGDGHLTRYSADYLTEWLEENGVAEPRHEFERGLREDRAAVRRDMAYTRILPIDLVQLWVETESEDEVFDAIEDRIGDAVERTALYLRLYGCDGGSWNLQSGWDQRLAAELAAIDQRTMAKAMGALAGDTEGARGVARLVLGEGRIDVLDDQALARALPAMAEVGLSHERRINRTRTIYHLGRIGSAEAVHALRRCLHGEIEVEEIPEEESIEPGGWVTYIPADNDIDPGCSERAYSALVLAELGDRASLPVIEMLAEQADGEDGVLLGEALKLLAE
jgi:hypothetical protein